LKIGYLMNSFPITSTTFIRREMESLEALGLEIERFAVRRWPTALVDPLDIADQKKTHYLLDGNFLRLITAFFSVLLFNPIGFFKAFKIWLNVCSNSLRFPVKHVAYLMQATYFYRLCKQKDLKHVHVHFSTNATTVAMLAKCMGGPSYSFTAHGPDEFVDPSANSMNLKVKHATFVAAISNYCRVQLVRFSSYEYWDKIVIVHCGLQLDEFVPNYDFNVNNQYLVCVGRLCPQKAQLLLPPALAQLKADFPNLKVHFVGDGESRQALEQSIKKYNVEEMVELHGWMVNADVRQLVSKSRAFLLPSFAEGLPVGIMEALALGRPVISTYIAGIPELVDNDCGWIIPAGSIEHIASAIRQALNETPAGLKAKGVEGRKRIEREHNLKLIAPVLFNQFALAVKEASKKATGLLL
jgi:colanic acid/amylovoran biosynthesis glycosyltransferase